MCRKNAHRIVLWTLASGVVSVLKAGHYSIVYKQHQEALGNPEWGRPDIVENEASVVHGPCCLATMT